MYRSFLKGLTKLGKGSVCYFKIVLSCVRELHWKFYIEKEKRKDLPIVTKVVTGKFYSNG